MEGCDYITVEGTDSPKENGRMSLFCLGLFVGWELALVAWWKFGNENKGE